MNGIARFVIAFFLAGMTFASSWALEGHVFVIGSRSAANPTDDQPLLNAITALGLTFTYNNSGTVRNSPNAAALVEGHDLIYISESIGSTEGAGLNTAVGNLDIPLIHAESGINFEMGMGNETGGTFEITDVTIVDDTLSAANGLSGIVTIFPSPGEMVHGDPPASATVVAECLNPAKDGMLPCVFYFDKGDQMLDRAAPDKCGFYLANRAGMSLINADGRKLFDGLLTYFLTPPAPDTAADPDSWAIYE